MNRKNRLPVIIIGGGLSGLLTAYRLKKAGVAVKILEARERAGGRINTMEGADGTPLEMGATWFGNQHEHLKNLLEEFELRAFKQYMIGGVLFEASPFSSPQRINIPPQDPRFRIEGGTGKLIQVLVDSFTAEEIKFNEQVKQIVVEEEIVKVITNNRTFSAMKVVCCISPALVVNSIKFQSELPEAIFSESLKTHTWMQESVKAGVVIKNLSGRAKTFLQL